jgi:hypothetical protein
MVSRGAAVLNAYESELPRLAGKVAVVWQFALLFGVLADLHAYRQPAAPIVVWLGLLAAAAWLVPRAWAGGLSAWEAAGAIAVAVTAVAVLGWDRSRAGMLMNVDWSAFGTGWLLVIVALSRPPRAWATGAVLVFATYAIFTLRLMGETPSALARVAATGYLLIVIPIVFGALRPALRAQATVAARRATLASRTETERAALNAVRDDRQARLAVLEQGALPLLRGIADGSLDPGDSEVMRRCADHATALRHVLVDRARHGSWLLDALAPALEAGRARGLPVETQVVGDPGPPAPEAAHATAAVLTRILRSLPPQPVVLTILAADDDVELYVTFRSLPTAGGGLGSLGDLSGTARMVPEEVRWRAAFETCEAGSGCLEIRWRKADGQ